MTLRVTGIQKGEPVAVSCSICPHCLAEFERTAIRASGVANHALVDPAEVALVYKVGKHSCYEMKDGSKVTDPNTSIEQIAEQFHGEMVEARHGVLVRRELISEAKRMSNLWFLKLKGRDGLVGVSRRHWSQLQRMFNGGKLC